jgi:hypothetical protein
MTQKALKMALEVNESMKDVLKQVNELIAENKSLKEALTKEKTLQALHSENERLGLYKDAYAQPEPAAWVAEDVCEGQYIDGRPRKIWWECKEGVGTAFYTHPPQRTWVGLTDEEIDKWTPEIHVVIQAIEAKLKEKNT